MCARLGLVTGHGLGGIIRKRYPPAILWGACLLLLIANIFNIAADLGGMADAMHMVTGIPAYWWTPFFAALITGLLIWTSYKLIARVFKWLTLVLFAYIVTAFLAHPNWSGVIHATLVPHVTWTREYMSILVGILGTTISPYLFFWQAAQEVESEREQGKRQRGARRRGALTDEELQVATRPMSTETGMFYSNLVMYFIILTTAATLHAHGINQIETAQQAAEALRPLAGRGAYWLFTLGLLGTGRCSLVPVLAGSCAYAISEAATWRESSISERTLPRRAPQDFTA